MADNVSQIVKDVEQEIKESPSQNSMQKGAQVRKSSPSERDTDVGPESNDERHERDFFKMFAQEFLTAPFLSLIEEYVRRCNNKNRALGPALGEFGKNHPIAFKAAIIGDFLMKIIYLMIILILGLRAVGLDTLIIKYFAR